MGFWKLSGATVIAASLGFGSSSAAEPQTLIEVFQKRCLEHLPDFSGSKEALVASGFARNGDRIFWTEDGNVVRVVLEMFSTGEAFAGAVIAEAGN